MFIRKYEEKDLESCTEIIKETSEKYVVNDIIPWKEGEFIWFFDLDTNRENIEKFFLEAYTLVAEDERQEIIWVLRAIENRIRSFFVRLDKIHQWVWKALFDEYIKNMEWKYEFLYIFSSSYAVEFYKRLWFDASWEKVLRNDWIWAYPMKKSLK